LVVVLVAGAIGFGLGLASNEPAPVSALVDTQPSIPVVRQGRPQLPDEAADADLRGGLLAALELPPNERNRAVRVAMNAWIAADGAAAISAARADPKLRDVADRMTHFALYAYPELFLEDASLLAAVHDGEHLVTSAATAIARYEPDVARALVDKYLSPDYAKVMRSTVDHFEKLSRPQSLEESFAELESVLAERDRRKQLSRLHWLINRVARDDPARAAGLIDAVRRPSRGMAMDFLVEVWSRTDPQGAADWLAGKSIRAEDAWQKLALGWGSSDFDAANAYAETLTEDVRGAFLTGLSGVAGRKPLREAQAWLSRYEHDAVYPDLVATIAPQLAERDPRVALSMLADLPEDRRFESTMGLMPMVMMDDPARLIDAIAELGNDSLRAELLPMISSRWARDDPETALNWASTLERGAVRDRVLANIARLAMEFDIGLGVAAIDEIDDAELRANPVRNLLMVIESDAEAIRRGSAYGVNREAVLQLREARRSRMSIGSSGSRAIYIRSGDD